MYYVLYTICGTFRFCVFYCMLLYIEHWVTVHSTVYITVCCALDYCTFLYSFVQWVSVHFTVYATVYWVLGYGTFSWVLFWVPYFFISFIMEKRKYKECIFFLKPFLDSKYTVLYGFGEIMVFYTFDRICFYGTWVCRDSAHILISDHHIYDYLAK